MKKLTLILTLLTLPLYTTKAQDFFFPVQLPESIKTIDTSHVLHFGLYESFKTHTDITFPPIIIEREGYEPLYLSMVICTMTHEPYFTIITPFDPRIPLDNIKAWFITKNGLQLATFKNEFLRSKTLSKHHIAWAFSLADKLMPKGKLLFYFCLFDHDTSLALLKKIAHPDVEMTVMFKPNAGSEFNVIFYEKTLQEKDAQILKQSIQIYEDYIEVNGIDNQFVRN
ncbi:hypothetical protein FHS56_001688 [Thermonema lapsum]|uniref:Uncharacterized protein n=1 Tax=Thermonema lapsum TaxID=28195 RepID=A0A846MRT8_9BACT|nr:hypothetical protein [Thermonema lapsum]NIK74175.1 hypothetical protein [Thermonema lapsum]